MQPAGVDHRGLDLADRERDRAGDDPFVRGLALESRQGLRVVDPLPVEPGRQDHGGGHERTRQGAAAGLVHPGDPGEPCVAEHPLVPIEIARQCSHVARDGGQMVTNAWPITRSIGM